MTESAVPEIANIHPDFPVSVAVPHLITGESFDAPDLELWTWAPPIDDAAVQAAATLPRVDELPATPPADAVRIDPIDVERQAIVAPLTGNVLWIRSRGGWSKPCLFNVARPFWISDRSARAGDMMHLYGFGVRPEIRGLPNYDRHPKPPCRIALVGAGGATLVPPLVEGRSTQWVTDSRLVYFRLPGGCMPGHYAVWVHNGYGGAFGWAKAGEMEVLPRHEAPEAIYDVRTYGAKGDGLANDHAAITAALSAAGGEAGGTVFLPPGTYRIDETLYVPAGVTLRGASRENTVVQGFGYDGAAGAPPAAVVRLTDNTELRGLTLTGAVGKGLASVVQPRSDMSSDAMVRIEANSADDEVVNVRILDCRIRALEEDPDRRDTLYLKAIYVGRDCFGRCRQVKINNNEIHGSLFFWRAERMEIVRNTWRDTTATIVVAIHGWATDSLLDSNLFIDTPGRLCFYPVRHCCIRYNEIHGAFKGTWTNAEEVYLVHGSYGDYFGEGHRKTVGRATAGDATRLSDSGQSWPDGMHKDSVVLITGGRGFGQYRRVMDNTADTLTVERPWRVAPDATSEYVVGRMYMENDFFANLNDTPLRMSLWLDCICTVVDRHRDEFAKGIDIWGADWSRRGEDGSVHRPDHFFPSWYNMILDGWMDGSMAHLYSFAGASSVNTGLPMFGNYIAGNRVRQPHMHRTGFEGPAAALGGIRVGHFGEPGKRPQRTSQSHAIIVDNHVSFTNIGIAVAPGVRKTFLLDNDFHEVQHPIIDRGETSVSRENSRFEIDPEGWRVKMIE